jgi:hypothetical protein
MVGGGSDGGEGGMMQHPMRAPGPPGGQPPTQSPMTGQMAPPIGPGGPPPQQQQPRGPQQPPPIPQPQVNYTLGSWPKVKHCGSQYNWDNFTQKHNIVCTNMVLSGLYRVVHIQTTQVSGNGIQES